MLKFVLGSLSYRCDDDNDVDNPTVTQINFHDAGVHCTNSMHALCKQNTEGRIKNIPQRKTTLYSYKLNFTGLRQVRAVDTLRSCIRMPIIANACHLMDRKRLSSATECGVDAVTVTLPPDVAGRCDVSTTNRCSHSHKQLIVLDGTNPYTQLIALL